MNNYQLFTKEPFDKITNTVTLRIVKNMTSDSKFSKSNDLFKQKNVIEEVFVLSNQLVDSSGQLNR